jgi:hypothetical protein
VLLTRPPLPLVPKNKRTFDLHVLGTPPAFILSQDQTRHPCVCLHLCAVSAQMVMSAVCESRSRPSCFICTWLFADSCVCALQRTRLIRDRNCCGRLRVSPVAVLLSTLQLSRFMIKRLFRLFQSTQALLHISGTMSSVDLSIITNFTKTLVACYFRQNDLS